jgi:chemotaxis protein histidine kinase CheA
MFDDDFELPDDLLAMADTAASALADMGEEYAIDASKDADRLLAVIKQAQAAPDETALQSLFAEIFSIAHNFKGQGATFGYDLVTDFGEQLCELTRPRHLPTRAVLPQTMLLAAVLHTVLHQRLDGDGGTKGEALRTELAA